LQVDLANPKTTGRIARPVASFQDDLTDEMDAKAAKQFPGIVYNYSQPIIDNVAEAVAGYKRQRTPSRFSEPDLNTLEKYWRTR
jgi:Cu/Ag efflux pump CusA